jgi:tRNA dimethylallyltransferase
MEAKPLVVIVGPTASGKTSLAIDVAKRVGGEIICADSRTVYKGMDTGTAKPTADEQQEVPHWGLDLVEPDQRFTAADFKKYADQKITEIMARGNIPFLVGGTGLYIDAVIFDYQFGAPADPEQRSTLENMTLEELHGYCIKHNISLPQNDKNKRYVIRAIEQKSINEKRRKSPLPSTIIVGIATDTNELRTKIERRAEQLFNSGVVEEAKKLGEMYGWEHESMTGNIYPLCHEYIEGRMSLEEAKDKFKVLDWRLAKRQITWLRRNPHIQWFSPIEAKNFLLTSLAPEH